MQFSKISEISVFIIWLSLYQMELSHVRAIQDKGNFAVLRNSEAIFVNWLRKGNASVLDFQVFINTAELNKVLAEWRLHLLSDVAR